jgi:hypothetical protein
MTVNRTELPALHEPLDTILRFELDLGNEIAEIQIGGWSEVDIVVSLKFPFRRDYREEFPNVVPTRES